jgi:hypothetical protein
LSKLSHGFALGAAGVWWLAMACSVLVDPDELSAGCAEGMKACEVTPGAFRCVSRADADYGCARDSCVPCTLPHAIEVCGADGACAVGTCERGYENCDFVARTGCEISLDTNDDNCGGCGFSCATLLKHMPHALSAQCSAGRCEVDECQDGFADCDNTASTGCEKALTPETCGRCQGCPAGTTCDVDAQRCD